MRPIDELRPEDGDIVGRIGHDDLRGSDRRAVQSQAETACSLDDVIGGDEIALWAQPSGAAEQARFRLGGSILPVPGGLRRGACDVALHRHDAALGRRLPVQRGGFDGGGGDQVAAIVVVVARRVGERAFVAVEQHQPIGRRVLSPIGQLLGPARPIDVGDPPLLQGNNGFHVDRVIDLQNGIVGHGAPVSACWRGRTQSRLQSGAACGD